MSYKIVNITNRITVPEGEIICIHAKQTDNDFSEIELFVYPEYRELDIRDGIIEEFNELSYWEPDFEEEYVISMIVDIYGQSETVYKQYDFDEEYPFDEWYHYMIKKPQPSLIDKTFNSFVLNTMRYIARNDENSYFYVYNPLYQDFLINQYNKVNNDRLIFLGDLKITYFLDYIKNVFGNDCAEGFINGIIEKKPWLNREYILRGIESIEWYYLIDIANELFHDDETKVYEIKQIIAKLFLAKRGFIYL